MTISHETLDILADIFLNTERPDKITVTTDPVSKSVTIVYEDMDDDFYSEVVKSL